MHSTILYALLLTNGFCNASPQIKRRQQAVAVPQAKVLVGNGGVTRPGMYSANLGSATGLLSGNAVPSSVVNSPQAQPSPGLVSMTYKGPPLNMSNMPIGVLPNIVPPNVPTTADGTQTLAPPSNVGPAPSNTQGTQTPDHIDVPPHPIEVNTTDAVSALSDGQRDEILKSTTTEDFVEGPPEFQEYILATAKDKLESVGEEADAYGIDLDQELAESEVVPTPEQYAEIQEFSMNVTDEAKVLSDNMIQLLDVVMDELRQNDTLDATPDGGEGQVPNQKRWVPLLLAGLGLVFDLAKNGGKMYETTVHLVKFVKNLF
ncbi:hypothetical protein TWF694_010374 [Orbilia ellipsospora]|uniref:Uncharacterized protein n=1 Tax=Orbilia ellipsospora TaxID=2528407 RepID=A0AAV9X9P0_9PEZI